MDLLSSRPFWPLRDGLPATFPPLERDASCDVAVIGAGISGALMAWTLAQAGIDVVVLDRREAAHGSTAGNTGLILYELDVMLHRLARHLGIEAATQAYRRCRAAMRTLVEIARTACPACELREAPSLYVAASRAHVPRLRREYEARRTAGLDVAWWPRARLAAESSLPHPAAIVSRAAQIDPYALTYGLLCAAQRRGVRVHDRTAVTRRSVHAREVSLRTSRDVTLRAREVVMATGFESIEWLPKPLGRLQSTFALATEPVAELTGWPRNGALVWDTADPYLYLRRTADGRVIIGGYDEPFRDPVARDRLLPGKAAALQRRLRRFFPKAKLETAVAWAGTFGVSADGLPFIGRHPALPRTWFALGFGGNGTTFSMIAAEIVREAILGRTDPDAALFALDRRKAASGRAGGG